jgi:hypothetical protein
LDSSYGDVIIVKQMENCLIFSYKLSFQLKSNHAVVSRYKTLTIIILKKNLQVVVYLLFRIMSTETRATYVYAL